VPQHLSSVGESSGFGSISGRFQAAISSMSISEKVSSLSVSLGGTVRVAGMVSPVQPSVPLFGPEE